MNLQVTGQLTGIEARNGGWFAVAVQEQGQEWPRKMSTKLTELVQQAQQLMGQQVTALYTEQESTNINPHSGQPYINRRLEGLSLAGQSDQQLAQTGMQVQQQQAQPQYSQPVQQPQPGPQSYQQQPTVQTWGQQVERQAQQQPQPLPQPGTSQTMTHVVRDDSLRELKIHRQSAAKVAVQLLPLIPLREGEEHNLAGLLRLSEALVRYFNEGVQWKVEPPSAGGNPGAEDLRGDPSEGSVIAGDPGPQPGDPGFGAGMTPSDDIPFAPSR